jgi:hypothetical protein
MKKAILTICVGELYWELARFVPYIIWKKKNEPDTDLIVITRKDRYDLYGQYATKFFPLEIEGDGLDKKAECFRLNKLALEEYDKIINKFYFEIKNEYEIVEKIYPRIESYLFAKMNQFSKDKFLYDYLPRERNKTLIENLVQDIKSTVIIAPRFREGISRNWIHWKEFYDLIDNSDLKEKFLFVLCGKSPDYIPDSRFIDLNQLEQEEDTSLIGLTIELIKKSKLVIGSQSAIPSLSLLLGTPVLQWGHNRINLMTDEYNPKKTKCSFLDDHRYSQKASVIFDEMRKIL